MTGWRWHRVATTGLVLAALGACAAFDGSALVAGRSTGADVEALMGAPTLRVPGEGGETVYFYPRPAARATFAVRLGADGVVRAVEQRLTQEHAYRIRRGEWREAEVRALLGPPLEVTRMDNLQRDIWEYRSILFNDPRVIWVQFSYDGVVQEVLEMRDFRYEPAGDASLP